MQGILTIIGVHLHRKFLCRGLHSHSVTSEYGELHLVIGDVGFATLLREIDAFSEEFRVSGQAARPEANQASERE